MKRDGEIKNSKMSEIKQTQTNEWTSMRKSEQDQQTEI